VTRGSAPLPPHDLHSVMRGSIKTGATYPLRSSRRRPSPQPANTATKVVAGVAQVSAALLGMLSLLVAALASTGFGLALAMGDVFGLDVLEVLHGPADYLAASAWVVVTILNGLARHVGEPQGVARAFITAFTVFVVVAIVGVIGAYAYRYRAKLAQSTQSAQQAARSSADWVAAHPRSWRVPAIILSAVLSGAVVLLIGRALLAVLTVALLTFVGGFFAAKSHFYETVIEPYECIKSRNAQVRRQQWLDAKQADERGDPAVPTIRPYQAVCVEVHNKDLGSHRGRRILATSESIALFDPMSGTVRVVPRKDAVVTFVDTL
jgi:hypothetical protein